MSFRTPLGRVRGLGSAKDGTHHWWAQRLTAIALVPLTVWFVVSILMLAGAERTAISEWLANPVTAGLLVLLIVATFHHGQLGLQVVIEDYVHTEAWKIGLIVFVKFAALLFGGIGIVSVLKLAFAG